MCFFPAEGLQPWFAPVGARTFCRSFSVLSLFRPSRVQPRGAVIWFFLQGVQGESCLAGFSLPCDGEWLVGSGMQPTQKDGLHFDTAQWGRHICWRGSAVKIC